MAGLASCGQHGRMHDMDALQSQDLRGLTPQALEALAQRMLMHVQQQAREIAQRDGEIAWRDAYSTRSRTPFRAEGGQHYAVMADAVPG